MEKINIAELLKDCPKGMELDCTIYDNVYFYSINKDDSLYPIRCYVIVNGIRNNICFTKFGEFKTFITSKCVIFPKGKTTWEGFVPPCKFKDGDIVALGTEKGAQLFIFKEYIYNHDYVQCYMMLDCGGEIDFEIGDYYVERFATEEEKEKLFQAIKENGYRWNTEIKTLEKLIIPKFKGGDKIRSKNKKDECFYIVHVDEDKHKYVLNIKGYCLEFKDQDNYELTNEPKFKVGDRVRKKGDKTATFTISDIGNLCYYCGEYVICNICYQDDYELVPNTSIEPKFKIGDKVRHKNNHGVVFTITNIEKDTYICGAAKAFWFEDQDKFELVPNKFDITTLKPFDKVLVRDHDMGCWHITFYEHYDAKKSYPYFTLGGAVYRQCIPYKGNEHLIGLVKECDDYYKTWINEES